MSPLELNNLFSLDLDSGREKDNVNVFADVSTKDAEFNICSGWKSRITRWKFTVSEVSNCLNVFTTESWYWCVVLWISSLKGLFYLWNVLRYYTFLRSVMWQLSQGRAGTVGLFISTINRAAQEEGKLKGSIMRRWKAVTGVGAEPFLCGFNSSVTKETSRAWCQHTHRWS